MKHKELGTRILVSGSGEGESYNTQLLSFTGTLEWKPLSKHDIFQ